MPVAVIVPRSGQQVSAESVTAWCRERIAAYKVPRAVYTTSALPLGPTGKILKAEVREHVIQGSLLTATGGGDA